MGLNATLKLPYCILTQTIVRAKWWCVFWVNGRKEKGWGWDRGCYDWQSCPQEGGGGAGGGGLGCILTPARELSSHRKYVQVYKHANNKLLLKTGSNLHIFISTRPDIKPYSWEQQQRWFQNLPRLVWCGQWNNVHRLEYNFTSSDLKKIAHKIYGWTARWSLECKHWELNWDFNFKVCVFSHNFKTDWKKISQKLIFFTINNAHQLDIFGTND